MFKVYELDFKVCGANDLRYAVEEMGFDGEFIRRVALLRDESTAKFLADAMNATARVAITPDAFVEV